MQRTVIVLGNIRRREEMFLPFSRKGTGFKKRDDKKRVLDKKTVPFREGLGEVANNDKLLTAHCSVAFLHSSL